MSTAIWSNSKPPPDKTIDPSFAGQVVVEIVYSRPGDTRAIITRDSHSLFRVHVETWHVAESAAAGAGYMSHWWLRQSAFTDSLIDAVLIARSHVGHGR